MGVQSGTSAMLLAVGLSLLTLGDLLSQQVTAAQRQGQGQLRVQRNAEFAKLDTDNNGRLSVEEYLQRGDNAQVLRRDFKLFDFSGNGSLSPSEFAGTPGVKQPNQRGDIPDPYEDLLVRAVEAMDEAYDQWDQRPNEQMNSTFFAINFSASLATDNRRRLDREIVAQADPDGDHMVSREEAKRFLEIQLGIRWTTGVRLRLADGRVVNFARFLRSDSSADNTLDFDEFKSGWWRPETAEADFAIVDQDGDKEITLREYTAPSGPNLVDPVADFRQADTNFDALLDVDELTAATPHYRANLVRSTLVAFDEDADDKLSLREYRLSMLGNYNYAWATVPRDENNDDQLSFEEFVFFSQRSLFQLQRRFYFHRLDRDRDAKLSMAEFEFKGKPRHSLYRVDLETGTMERIFQRKEYPGCGSPSVSADGKWIAFDVTPIEGVSKTRIMTMSSEEGQQAKDLGTGLMPTWSPDGKQLACSRYEGGSGVWIIQADGSGQERISDGWGAQWSPDGKSIAFTNDNSLRVYDVDSGEIRTVLAKGAHPYQYIFWNMCWSPDSRQIVFKGRLTNQQELAIVQMTGEPQLKTYHASDKQIAVDLAWSPDGERIVFNMHSPEANKSLVYGIRPGSGEPPELLEQISSDQSWGSLCFSPDGKHLFLSSQN